MLLHPVKREWLMGENILVHFQVLNCGSVPFKVDFGGDYRGASRHLRFKARVTDARGRAVADPNPTGFCLGGLSSSRKLRPGESFHQTLALTRYARFERPGVYTVRIAHDLGWPGRTATPKIPATDSRWGVTKIKLAMPTLAQARQVVRRVYQLPTDPNASWGKRSRVYADFTCLRYPVYLPILLARARAARGDKQALWGVAQIPTPQATAALIRLARHPDAKFARQAVGALSYRLPDPQLQGRLPKRNPFFNAQLKQRRYMVKRAWRPRFASAVRQLARGLLARRDTAPVRSGAFLLEAVGTRAELPGVIRALDWAVSHTTRIPLRSGIYPRPRGACQELLRAVKMLLSRGAQAPRKPQSAGQIVTYLSAWGPKAAAQRPKSYDRLAGRWLGHHIPYVRELVLTLTRGPVSRAVARLLPSLLLARNVDLQIAACHAVTRSPQPRFRQPLLQLMARAKARFLVDAAAQAARALKLPRDQIAKAWAQRIGDPSTAMLFFGQVVGLVIRHRCSTGSSGKMTRPAAQRLQRRWLRFIRANRAAIRAGRLIPLGDPRLTVDLFPRGFRFHCAGKPPWPPKRTP